MAILNCRGLSTQMEFHAIRFVCFANHGAQFASQNFFQGKRPFSDYCDFEFALPQ